MKKQTVFLAAGIFFLAAAAHGAPTPKTAKADLVDAQGQPVGTATFQEVGHGVRINLEVRNLPPGVHAFHIHSAGKCDLPDFKSAGPHFNPEGKKHGTNNPQGAHAGDLPNLVVGTNGTGHLVTVAHGVTLGEGTNSLFQTDGTSVVIHAGKDDNKTDPSGNSGDRIACGVVTH